ncbi:PD-(D/E)XK nuclease family protein [Candidatus Microgenomates bacterium]|nr:MAG: PD-(D/E)XK nuclease family protein [Candidatus Microgenomates bacterium]
MNSFTYPLWISHSSIGDFLNCPRLYFLRQIYKDPKTGKKINIINPSLALGLTVHDTLESLAILKAEDRFKESLFDKYENLWANVSGELGGFKNKDEEMFYKNRGKDMIKRVVDSPGPLLNKALKLKSPDSLPPRYLISEEENILLCGKVDWLEYFPEDNSVHIIDFKTGVNEEKANSLQLPIYTLLVKNCQKRKISKMSYWYLEKDNSPQEVSLPDFDQSNKRIMEVALQIKKLREDRNFNCLKGGCFACKPFENIISGKAKYIKTSGYQDIYISSF